MCEGKSVQLLTSPQAACATFDSRESGNSQILSLRDLGGGVMLVRPVERNLTERLESTLPESLRHAPVDAETLELFRTLDLETHEQRVQLSKLVPTILDKECSYLSIKLSQNS